MVAPALCSEVIYKKLPVMSNRERMIVIDEERFPLLEGIACIRILMGGTHRNVYLISSDGTDLTVATTSSYSTLCSAVMPAKLCSCTSVTLCGVTMRMQAARQAHSCESHKVYSAEANTRSARRLDHSHACLIQPSLYRGREHFMRATIHSRPLLGQLLSAKRIARIQQVRGQYACLAHDCRTF